MGNNKNNVNYLRLIFIFVLSISPAVIIISNDGFDNFISQTLTLNPVNLLSIIFALFLVTFILFQLLFNDPKNIRNKFFKIMVLSVPILILLVMFLSINYNRLIEVIQNWPNLELIKRVTLIAFPIFLVTIIYVYYKLILRRL